MTILAMLKNLNEIFMIDKHENNNLKAMFELFVKVLDNKVQVN